MRKRWTVRMISFGPAYVAIETNCTEQAHISRAWIREVAEPFRTGQGWRVRLGHFALQGGRCTKNPEVGQDTEALREHLFMRWLPYTPPEGTRAASDQGSDQGAGQHEVRADEPVVVQHDGVVGGSGLPDVQPDGVEASPTGGQEDGPQEGGPTGQEGRSTDDVERGRSGSDSAAAPADR